MIEFFPSRAALVFRFKRYPYWSFFRLSGATGCSCIRIRGDGIKMYYSRDLAGGRVWRRDSAPERKSFILDLCLPGFADPACHQFVLRMYLVSLPSTTNLLHVCAADSTSVSGRYSTQPIFLANFDDLIVT